MATLVERDLPWLTAHVHKRLGKRLRRLHETQDIVHQAMVEVLRYGPPFVVPDQEHFRALLARMVGNVLCGEHDRWTAGKRDLDRERPLPSAEEVLRFDDPASFSTPSQVAAREELSSWVRLALELLDPEDRRIVLWREYQGWTFAAIGERLGVPENTARMRFQRALPRLGAKLVQLRRGRVLEAASEDET